METMARNLALKEKVETTDIVPLDEPIIEQINIPVERVNLDPVGLSVALNSWYDLWFRGFKPDMPDQMLDTSTGINWFARCDFKRNMVMLHRKGHTDTRIFELDKDWFENLGRLPMKEVYFDGELEVYIPIE